MEMAFTGNFRGGYCFVFGFFIPRVHTSKIQILCGGLSIEYCSIFFRNKYRTIAAVTKIRRHAV